MISITILDKTEHIKVQQILKKLNITFNINQANQIVMDDKYRDNVINTLNTRNIEFKIS